MQALPMRQIHLDFHTSGFIDDVGQDWDAAAFVQTLRDAHVNSVTCFARCHHGYVYYAPTRFVRHPSLTFDLLGQQIEACHRAGIRAPIYITVGWDELTARMHPEWLEVTPEGVRGQHSPLVARWSKLCLNSEYLDYVWEQTQEVMDRFGADVDGFFFDIIHQGECVCPACLRDMAAAGLDAANAAHRRRFASSVLDAYRRRFAAGVRARLPEATIFHNAGHIGADLRPTMDAFSHFELESLPSTGTWGYLHFPITVRYARTLGKPLLGMTGKFHTSWGDFASFKNRAALEFECFQMLASGAACSIGDQLHPRGRLSAPAYDLIGNVYASVEAKEPWCAGATPLADIALFNVEAIGAEDGRVDSAHAGAARMLIEGHHQFDVVDQGSDWSAYRVLVLADKVVLTDDFAARIERYLQGGGCVIASHRSGLTADGSRFAIEYFGVERADDAPFDPAYLVPEAPLGASLPAVEHVMYDRELPVRAGPGCHVLGWCHGPYFARSWDRFCSHRQTPDDARPGPRHPGIVHNARGNVIYFAAPIFTGYRQHAARWYRELFLAAMRLLLPRPLVYTDAPTTAHLSLLRQREKGRTILHILHYIPERRGTEFDTLEDVIPLYGINVQFRCDRPSRVYLAPQGEPLDCAYADGYARVCIPEVRGHQMVVAE